MARVDRVCVIGSGNGAFGVAGNLALEGRKVALWDCDAFRENLIALQDAGNSITVTGAALQGTAKLHRVTGNLNEAISENDVILVVIPSFALSDTAHRIAGVVKPGTKIFLCSGSTGGALEFAKILALEGKLDGIKLGEYTTLPYGCKKTGPHSVNIATHLQFNQFAAFPAILNDELYEDARDLFPCTEAARDVMECSLNNGNILLHGPVMLMNAAGTESRPDNHHYRDGLTPSISRVMDKMDEERMAVCRALGYKPISTVEAAVRKGYCPKLETNSYDSYRGSKDFMTSPGPTTLNHRYMTEDIPYSALVVSVFGKILGVPTPLFDAMITICGALMDKDYHHTGRTAEALGIGGMKKEELLDFLKHGYPPAEDRL